MNSVVIYWGGGNVTRNRDSRISVILSKISQSLTMGHFASNSTVTASLWPYILRETSLSCYDGKLVAVHVNN